MWLEAPLQSWGYNSIFDRRDTLNFPTKSGIMGLICCALGYGGEQTEFLAKFASLKQTILAFSKSEKANKAPMLCDYHVIGAGFDSEDPWQTLMIPKNSKGKKKVKEKEGSATKITHRYYLQDVAFAVILEVPRDEIEKIAKHLEFPVWDLYLGRKNCIPTDVIYRGKFDDHFEATKKAKEIAEDKKNLYPEFKACDQSLKLEDNEHMHIFREILLNDVPLNFGIVKKYTQRYVRIIHDK